MALAIEERDLRKMAALSQQDSEKDELQQVINQLRQVNCKTAEFDIVK